MRVWNWLAYFTSILISIGAIVACFRGTWQIRLWLIVACVLPVARLVVDKPWRTRTVLGLIELWNSLSNPETSESRRWLAALVFAGIPSLLVFSIPETTFAMGDSYPVIPTAISVVREGNCNISEYWDSTPADYQILDEHGNIQPYCFQKTPSGKHSAYPSGMLTFAIPVVFVNNLFHADINNPKVQAALERWCSHLVASLLVLTFFRLALTIASPASAWVACVLLTVGSSYETVIAHALWQHGGVALGVQLILLVELDSYWRSRKSGMIVQAFSAGLMFACRLSSGWLLAVIGLWIVVNDWRRSLRFAIVTGLGILPWVAFYHRIYGSPIGPSGAQAGAGNWHWMEFTDWLGVMVSPSRGFILYQPWFILAVFGSLMRLRSSLTHASWLAIIGHSILVACWWCWWGGACWGSRLMTDVLPFLAILALPAINGLLQTRRRKILLAVIVIVSAAPHAVLYLPNRTVVAWWCGDTKALWHWPKFEYDQ